MDISIVAHGSLADVDPSGWDALVSASGGNVFLTYAYLRALETTGCVGGRTGWMPRHLIGRNGAGTLIGAIPIYVKTHSYGEYVFDWAWADAYRRAGGEYYPKLLAAVPFTPCSGPRVLAVDDQTRLVMMQGALALAAQSGASSLHVLFPPEHEASLWQKAGLMLRQGVQFHWENRGFADFDAMLASMTHDKRKRIKQDRRYVAQAGVTWRVSRGAEIGEADWEFFYRCYDSTYRAHMSTPYLSLELFQRLGHDCEGAAVLFVGERDGEPLCASLCIASGDTVYGRYWGTLEPLKSLHFEACYYQPIEWCIANHFQHFEGGAQGAHKLARGLLPTATYSVHWLADQRFAAAVDDYLARETIGVAHTLEELGESSPFKSSDPRSRSAGRELYQRSRN